MLSGGPFEVFGGGSAQRPESWNRRGSKPGSVRAAQSMSSASLNSTLTRPASVGEATHLARSRSPHLVGREFCGRGERISPWSVGGAREQVIDRSGREVLIVGVTIPSSAN
jgi:hypothetical protein